MYQKRIIGKNARLPEVDGVAFKITKGYISRQLQKSEKEDKV